MAFIQSALDQLALGIASMTTSVNLGIHPLPVQPLVLIFPEEAFPTIVNIHEGAVHPLRNRPRVLAPGESRLAKRDDQNLAWVYADPVPVVVSPARRILHTIRAESLVLRRISYTNPLEFDVLAAMQKSQAGGVLSWFKFFNTGRAERKLAEAVADREFIRAILDDAGMDMSIDLRAAQLEEQELRNQILAVELADKRLALKERQVALANEVIRTQKELANLALGGDVWSNEQAMEIMNSVRTVTSLDMMSFFRAEFKLLDED